MKKKLTAILALTLLVGMNETPVIIHAAEGEETLELKVYNWQDYMFLGDEETESINDSFETYYKEKYGRDVNVIYATFETNENMLNVIKTGSEQFDLICPSDYMIQKMISQDLLVPFTKEIENYESFASPYIKDIFENTKATLITGDEVSWSEYAIPYMWGTMGFMYNPENVAEDDIQSWEIIWNQKYQYKATLKDSIRDTYAAAVLYIFRDELMEASEQYENGELDAKEYNAIITDYMNRCSDDVIAQVEEALRAAKKNIYGFEVDNGKSDIVQGKYDINFCWSGDAVSSMDIAEEDNDFYLNYVVPKEGSNIWFDGWVMPKGANVELAQEYLNYLCLPENAALNMNEIGYTSAIAGEEIFDLVLDWYGIAEEEYEGEDINALIEAGELFAVDLSYFFEGSIEGVDDFVVITEEVGRQFSAQYPEYETIVRCAVMEDFGDQNNAVTGMWVRIKGEGEVPLWMWIVLLVFFVVTISYISYKYASKRVRVQRTKAKRAMSQIK